MNTDSYHTKTIKVFYFHNGMGGGVLSVIQNLLKYSQNPLIENHVIYTINGKKIKNFIIPKTVGAVTEQLFYYSPNWNFHYTCKQLSKLLPDENVVIVANDWLELGMVSYLGLSNPVVQILHGDYDYYYNLSLNHQGFIDTYITVAEAIACSLRHKNPKYSSYVHYFPFPVPFVQRKSIAETCKPLEIIFAGRLTNDKGYNLLPLIESELKSKRVKVKWHIVGEFTASEKSVWKTETDIEFYGQVPNEKVIEIMQGVDVLLLPSLAEGMPLAVVEGMKVGLTCLVNDIPGGIQEIIINGETGYKVEKNNVLLYAEIIEKLSNDRDALHKNGEGASEKANICFNPVINTLRYEALFQRYYHLKRNRRKVQRVYGSRLDQIWIPNFITNAIRTLINKSALK